MIGTGELIVIFCVVLLLFGGKRLPELARSLGGAIREFKGAFHGLDDAVISKPEIVDEKPNIEKQPEVEGKEKP